MACTANQMRANLQEARRSSYRVELTHKDKRTLKAAIKAEDRAKLEQQAERLEAQLYAK